MSAWKGVAGLMVVALALSGCAAVAKPMVPLWEGCPSEGWVDRVEGEWVVVDDGDEEESLVVPRGCFVEPVQEGTKVVNGRIDWTETLAVRAEIKAIMGRLSGSSRE